MSTLLRFMASLLLSGCSLDVPEVQTVFAGEGAGLCSSVDPNASISEVKIVIRNMTNQMVVVSSGHRGPTLGKSFLLDSGQTPILWPTHSGGEFIAIPCREAIEFRTHLGLGRAVAFTITLRSSSSPPQDITSDVIIAAKRIELNIVESALGVALVASGN